MQVFWHYFLHCGGYYYFLTFVIAALLNSGTQVFNNLWLSWWSSNKYNFTLEFNMRIYGITAVAQFGFALVINCVFLIGGYRAAKYYHKAVMTR